MGVCMSVLLSFVVTIVAKSIPLTLIVLVCGLGYIYYIYRFWLMFQTTFTIYFIIKIIVHIAIIIALTMLLGLLLIATTKVTYRAVTITFKLSLYLVLNV